MTKEESHVFRGMQRDVSMSKSKPEFLWEAHNIRIINQEEGALLVITNYLGNEQVDLGYRIVGNYVGHCVLDKYLVLFTVKNDLSNIYRIEKKDDDFEVVGLYTGNLGFDVEHPLETLASYETDSIQKVYWVDGIHQPRMINIMKTYGPNDDTLFDFIATLKLEESVTVNRIATNGMFRPGVIQYAFTYYNLNSRQTNIFYTTPLLYIAKQNKGGSPEETIGCSFEVTINNVDTNFDYVRVYSIHRTSLDAVPAVKRVIDLKIDFSRFDKNPTLTFIDTGMIGSVVDNYELLYIGGKDIIALTIAQKDNTLFLGNLTLNKSNEIRDLIKDHLSEIISEPIVIRRYENELSNGDFYDYEPIAIKSNTAGFKTNEIYRLGVLALTKTGEWTDPVFYGDDALSTIYPLSDSSTITQWSKKLNFPESLLDSLKNLGVKKLRTCVVFPNTTERSVICQGVLCPTVYMKLNREENSPYALASWFFRPAITVQALTDLKNFNRRPLEEGAIYNKGANIQFEHGKRLFSGGNFGAEIQCSDDNINNKNNFYVDENIVTMHSPDIEFDTSFHHIDYTDVSLKLIGLATLDSISGDMNILASSGWSYPLIIKKIVGYSIGENTTYENKVAVPNNGGMVAMPYYKDALVPKNLENELGGLDYYYLVYPWHRSGSLNNDTPRSEGSPKTRSAILKTKILSNLKFFGNNKFINQPIDKDITEPRLFDNNVDVSLLKLDLPYLKEYRGNYFGNYLEFVLPYSPYPIYGAENGEYRVLSQVSGYGGQADNTSSDGVMIKYKSSPHLTFSLKGDKANEISLLPRLRGYGDPNETVETDLALGLEAAGDANNWLLIYWIFSTKEMLELELGWDMISSNRQKYVALVPNLSYENGVPSLDRNEFIVYEYSKNDHMGWVRSPVITGGHLKFKLNHNYIQVKGFSPEALQLLKQYLGVPDALIVNNTLIGSGNMTYYNVTAIGEYVNLFKMERNESLAETLEVKRTWVDYNADSKPYLWLAELINNDIEGTKFGGTTESALTLNIWYPASEPVKIDDLLTNKANLTYKYGDTWYSRYDCLKTMPFTFEDENQIVEIGSFLCETRINLDGRYDTRGNRSNVTVTELNFNKLNTVYNLKDNFFSYNILEDRMYKDSNFRTLFTWSREKMPAIDIDPWTNVTLANTYDLMGDKGNLNAITKMNDYLFCFQDNAISLILFNVRAQISVSDGVPVEISNGGKLEGVRYISEFIGCQNKWSMVSTPLGVYFIDYVTNGIYLFNGQTTVDLSTNLGLYNWVADNYTPSTWKNTNTRNQYNGIKSFYDAKRKDVYFVPGKDNSNREALCYSEKLSQFISFVNFEKTCGMVNMDNEFYSIYDDNIVTLWKNFSGEYNKFYGLYKPYSISFISNEYPTMTKVFDSLEYRSDCWEYKVNPNNRKKEWLLLLHQVFDTIRAENEYQDTFEQRLNTLRNAVLRLGDTSVRNKFRAWRSLIPRNNNFRERIRNPWVRITLKGDPQRNLKFQLHDMTVKYTL